MKARRHAAFAAPFRMTSVFLPLLSAFALQGCAARGNLEIGGFPFLIQTADRTSPYVMHAFAPGEYLPTLLWWEKVPATPADTERMFEKETRDIEFQHDFQLLRLPGIETSLFGWEKRHNGNLRNCEHETIYSVLFIPVGSRITETDSP